MSQVTEQFAQLADPIRADIHEANQHGRNDEIRHLVKDLESQRASIFSNGLPGSRPDHKRKPLPELSH